jgi:uncharacterized protein (DUF302 family)
MDYGMTIRTHLPFAEAVARVRQALKDQGFGVLTEIDVQATLRDRLGQDMEDYLILGACNPPLAHRALDTDRKTGLLLPCNVVVRTEGAQTIIEALNPPDHGRSGRPALAQASRGRGHQQDQGRTGLTPRHRRASTLSTGSQIHSPSRQAWLGIGFHPAWRIP